MSMSNPPLPPPISTSDRSSSVSLKMGQAQLLIFAGCNGNQTYYSISADALTYISKDFFNISIPHLCISVRVVKISEII